MPPRSREKLPTENFEITRLQKQVLDLQEQNSILTKKIDTTTNDLTNIVVFLKNTIEEKDEELARLEELVAHQDKKRIKAIMKEKEENEDKLKLLEEERDGLKTQINMISTQLTNQKRMELEMKDMRVEMKKLQEIIEHQRETIDQKENCERAVKIMTTEIVRQEMTEELKQEITNTREQLQLERDAQLLMNQRIIEHLQSEIRQLVGIKDRLSVKLEASEAELTTEKAAKEIVEKERDNLRRLFEKSSSNAEKTVTNMRKRVQEAENRRQKAVQEQTDVSTSLNNKIVELQGLLKTSNLRADHLEKKLLEEKQIRLATVAAHSLQNAKLAELKEFLTICLAGDPLADQVLGESRTAVFGQLSLIVSQIPTVK